MKPWIALRHMTDESLRQGASSRNWPAVAACAALFFLGTADRLFAIRVHGVNVRLAQLGLFGGLIVWVWKKGFDSRGDLRNLFIGWTPFFIGYLLVSALSADPALGLLKLGWFALNFLGAYAWCQLFQRRDLATGYFSAFLIVAMVMVLDFFTGFVAGPAHMIGYAQPSYAMSEHERLYRPHAFYYEPSYAATGLGLAWALALTTVRAQARKISTVLIIVGIGALAVTFSRVGWIYALIVVAAIAATGSSGLRFSWRRGAAYSGFAALLLLLIMLTPQQNRRGAQTLLWSLGVSQTIERVCPILREEFPSWHLRCLEGAARVDYLAFNGRTETPEQTSEGARLFLLESALNRIRQHPFIGVGVTRGAERLLWPTVPNTWLELGAEGGALALLAFAWGLASTLYRWNALKWENRAVGIVLVLYFVVSWQFVQTFPRLDQWLSFWMALTVLAANDDRDVSAS